IDAIDEATIRAGRFDIKAQVALPDEAARREIFASKLAEIDSQLSTDDDTFTPFAQDINITELAAHMPEKSGADIVEVLRRATFEKAMTEIASHSTQNVPISQADLLKIIAAMRFEP
ncbi:ATP-binding protein, partial [Candidatus Saccharibacteria bacterium]|nr:ATP-binding protein [Candidatus Saccharibacteria bacterium]